jgi:hypothetical protein
MDVALLMLFFPLSGLAAAVYLLMVRGRERE